MGYLIDSNVLIDYVAERFNANQLKSLDRIFDEELNISVITKIEILGFNSLPNEEIKMKIFLSSSTIISLTDDIVERTIHLRKTTKLKIADAIIAASALCFNFELITNNINDFKNLNGLKFLNPYRL